MKPRNLAALHHALAEVYSGAELVDAEAVADQLEDLGFRVVEKDPMRPYHLNPRSV